MLEIFFLVRPGDIVFLFFFSLSVDWTKKKKTCKTTDGQHLLLKAYLLRRRLRFYGGSLQALKERRQVIFVSHRKKGRCARPDHFPLHKAAREGSVIESNMSCLRLAELLQHVNRRLCSSWTALELFEL